MVTIVDVSHVLREVVYRVERLCERVEVEDCEEV
jgi:hypothetical protein